MTVELHAVLMAGGAGTRFWPASRARRPKHLLPMAGDRSLLLATVDRVRPIVGLERCWVVTSPAQADAVRAELTRLEGFAADHVVVEPEARDTAPCATLATAVVESRAPGAVVALMPSDHVVHDAAGFTQMLERGVTLAHDRGALVTFGVRPATAATGYGYIERGDPVDGGEPRAFAARSFREKPDAATAERYLASGRHLWNSGIFVWRADSLLGAMDAAAPELALAARRMMAGAAAGDDDELRAAFAAMPRTSIDFAVMERAPNVIVVEADIGWSDVGSFPALGAVADGDAAGNVLALREDAEAVLEDAAECVVWGEGPRLVALLGVRDLVVVAVGDAVLVCSKERAEDVKRVVARLEEKGRGDLL